MSKYHIPVMLEECLEGMNIQPKGCYIDVTFGGGGHSRAILARLSQGGRLYSVDQDPDAIRNIAEHPCFTFIASNFRHIDRFMHYYGEEGRVDAILADLGVSSHQLDEATRGFSFRSDTPLLDMRMNTRTGRSAREIIASYEEQRLANIIFEYGELRQSRKIARHIVEAREQKPIETIGELLEIVRPCISPKEEKKQLGQLFQAIRIEVNEELDVLGEMLEASTRILRPGGRLVIMTYHSLEDRIVKQFFRSGGSKENEQMNQIYGTERSPWKLLTRKPITPSPEEIALNPRSRSAKLRIAEWQG